MYTLRIILGTLMVIGTLAVNVGIASDAGLEGFIAACFAEVLLVLAILFVFGYFGG